MSHPRKIRFRGATYVLALPKTIKFRGATYRLADVPLDDALDTGQFLMSLLLRMTNIPKLGEAAKEALFYLTDVVQQIDKSLTRGETEEALLKWEELKASQGEGGKAPLTLKARDIREDPAVNQSFRKQLGKELHRYDGELGKVWDAHKEFTEKTKTTASVLPARLPLIL